MSKTQLKKLMANMTAEQLSELVLDLYAARKEAKEYLDFFVAPDIDARLEKVKTAIAKESKRTARRYARPRMSRIRRSIADISSLNPGVEPVLEIMTFAVEEMCRVGTVRYIKEVTTKNVAKLLTETLQLADKSGMLDVYLPRLHDCVSAMNTTDYYCGAFGRLMRDTLQDFCA